MSWRVAKAGDLNNIVQYLDRVESFAIQIYSFFISSGKLRFPNRLEAIVLINSYKSGINGIILVSQRGIIYPRFESRDSVTKEDLIKLMATIQVTIHGVVGTKDDVNFFDTIIFRRIRQINTYQYYTLPGAFPIASLNRDVIKANSSDHTSLLPLEIEYQREEVIVEESDLNKKAVSEALKRKLIEDDVYYIKRNKLVVTKGGTTFRSRRWVLLGGIFTWRRLRNQGLSTLLLKGLISDQLQKGYSPALFVKDSNIPAKHLYEKIGFTKPIPYQINYYKR